MPLKPETRADLMAQRKELEAEIEEKIGPLRRRVAAIEEILAADDREDSRGAEPQNSNGHIAPLAGKGMRESIQAVLDSVSDLKPAQVAKIMETWGYEDSDLKTALQVRVGNEMWRMAKDRILTKKGRGEYRLAEKK